MTNNYRRKDRQKTILLQQPPIDRVNPPRDDERRQKWPNRGHPGEHERNMRGRDRKMRGHKHAPS